jgi:hypothetical protein
MQMLCFLDLAEKPRILCRLRCFVLESFWIEDRMGEGVPEKIAVKKCEPPCFLDLTLNPVSDERVAPLCTATPLECKIAWGGGYPECCDPQHKFGRLPDVKIRSFLPSFRIWQ